MDIDSEEQTTRWHNPTQYDFDFKIFLSPGMRRRVRVPAGGEIELPSHYDDAIAHKAKGSNVVTGGLCPLLRKVSEGSSPSPVHPALTGASAKAPDVKECDDCVHSVVEGQRMVTRPCLKHYVAAGYLAENYARAFHTKAYDEAKAQRAALKQQAQGQAQGQGPTEA